MSERESNRLTDGRPFEERVFVALGAIRSEIAALDTKVETRFGALEIRMDALETRMGVLETRMDKLDARMDAIEERLTSLEERVDRRLLQTQPILGSAAKDYCQSG